VNNKIYKALIIGCGKIAGSELNLDLITHAGSIKADGRIELVGCVDCDYKKAQLFANQHQCKAFSDLGEALVRTSPDIVSICTPDSTHYEIAKKVLSISLPPKILFLEKPVCSNKAEFINLLELANQREILVVANHTRRFSMIHKTIRDLILAKKLGSPYRVNAIYYSGWLHNGSHIVDTIIYLFDEIINWKCITGMIPSKYPNDPTLELVGILEKSGAQVRISAIDEEVYQLFDFDLWFQEGRLRIEDFGNRVRLEVKKVNELGERVLEEVDINLPTTDHSDIQNAFSLMVNYLETTELDKLRDVTLKAIEPTMDSLWQARNLNLQEKRAL